MAWGAGWFQVRCHGGGELDQFRGSGVVEGAFHQKSRHSASAVRQFDQPGIGVAYDVTVLL